MEKFSDRLKTALSIRNMSAAELSRIIGVNEGTISNYKKGLYEPKQRRLEKIANALYVSIPWLMGADVPMDRDIYNNINDDYASPTVTEDTVTFPVIGELAAGYDHFMNEDYDTFDSIEVPTAYLKGRPKSDFIVLKIHGNSMYPIYMENDRVLIKKTSTLEHSGDIGVIQYEDCATLKKVEFVQGEDWLRLVPINPLYQPETISGTALEQCSVIGVPVLLVREVEQ